MEARSRLSHPVRRIALLILLLVIIGQADYVLDFSAIEVERLSDVEQIPVRLGTAQFTAEPTESEYALVVDDAGSVFRFQQGPLEFIYQPAIEPEPLRSVGWRPDGAYALVVGLEATVEKYNGTGFTHIDTGFPETVNFQSVAWKPDGSFALIAGSSGVVLRYDGASVTTIPGPATSTIRSVTWDPNGSSALLAGDNGTVLMYHNDTLKQLTTGTTSNLYTVAWNPGGQFALVAGGNGTILRYDGTGFTAFDTIAFYEPTHIVRSIAWDPTGNLALLVGDTGLVLSYDGSSMSRLTYNGSPNISMSNLYAVAWWLGTATIVGGSGNVFKFTGVIERLDSGVTNSLRAIGWTPPFAGVNHPPVLWLPGTSFGVDELSQLSFRAAAVDVDQGDSLSFSLGGEPSGAAISSAGVFTWTPLESQGPDVYSFSVYVTDNGGARESKQVTVTTLEVSTPPSLSDPGNQTISELTLLTFRIDVTDYDIPSETIMIICMECVLIGATFSPSTGIFSWVPNESQGPGDYSVEFSADDGSSSPARTNVQIHVREVNGAPELIVPEPLTVEEGRLVTFQVSASDRDVPADSVVLSASGLPPGASFDPLTGIFSWRPDAGEAGSYRMVFTATDNGIPHLSSSNTLQITVTQRPNLASSIPVWLPLGVLAGLIVAVPAILLRKRLARKGS